MKKIIIIGIVVITIAAALIISSNSQENKINSPAIQAQTSPTETITDAKASFVIFTNGTLRIFSDPRYHNLSTDIYLQSDNPNIVHVKKAEVTWDDFFKTLPMKLSYDCITTGTGQTFCSNANQKLKFYINGKLEPNALDMVIKNGDQLLVSYGNENEEEININFNKSL